MMELKRRIDLHRINLKIRKKIRVKIKMMIMITVEEGFYNQLLKILNNG
jgi:hypothetical protein